VPINVFKPSERSLYAFLAALTGAWLFRRSKVKSKEAQRNAQEDDMRTFSNTEFMQWAKEKKLSFVSQSNWPDAFKLIPPEEVATLLPTNTTSHANLYVNAKKELFLAVCVVPSGTTVNTIDKRDNSVILVFKQLTNLK
jgi:hypothetical protein